MKQNRIDAAKSVEDTVNLIDPVCMKNITVKVFHTEQISSDLPGLTEIYDSSKAKEIANIPRMVKVI